jgi:hypothetical protein
MVQRPFLYAQPRGTFERDTGAEEAKRTMTVLGLVLRYRLFTILALPLVWLLRYKRGVGEVEQLATTHLETVL